MKPAIREWMDEHFPAHAGRCGSRGTRRACDQAARTPVIEQVAAKPATRTLDRLIRDGLRFSAVRLLKTETPPCSINILCPTKSKGAFTGKWEESGAFRAGSRPDAEPFCNHDSTAQCHRAAHIGQRSTTHSRISSRASSAMRGKDGSLAARYGPCRHFPLSSSWSESGGAAAEPHRSGS